MKSLVFTTWKKNPSHSKSKGYVNLKMSQYFHI